MPETATFKSYFQYLTDVINFKMRENHILRLKYHVLSFMLFTTAGAIHYAQSLFCPIRMNETFSTFLTINSIVLSITAIVVAFCSEIQVYQKVSKPGKDTQIKLSINLDFSFFSLATSFYPARSLSILWFCCSLFTMCGRTPTTDSIWSRRQKSSAKASLQFIAISWPTCRRI